MWVLKSGGFAALPAIWVATMGHDPLRDEVHACVYFTAVSPVGLKMMTDLAQRLRESV